MTKDSKDSNAMDIDPPVPPTPTEEPASTSSTPNGTPAPEASSSKGKGKKKDSPKKDAPTGSKTDKKSEEDAEAKAEAAARAELLKDIPGPDLEAILSKKRAPGAHIDALSISVPQLMALEEKALELKAEGNKHFTAKPPKLDLARDDYLRALDCLPSVPKHLPPPGMEEERIREISDEEAEQIELDFLAGPERIRADLAIRETQKALWGNLGAVYSKQPTKNKETVEACTMALTFDPTYEKALLRRAAANERIGTWSSLVAAQNDCFVLTTLLPPDADALIPVRKALEVLPRKIAAAKKNDTNDVVGKMESL